LYIGYVSLIYELLTELNTTLQLFNSNTSDNVFCFCL